MTAGGCGRKVDSNYLSRLLSTGVVGEAGRDFTDAVWSDVRGEQMCTSVDLVYDFGSNPYELGRVAAVHALSDLYASMVRPTIATVALGLSRPLAEDERAARSVVRGYLDALTEDGVRFGGGHTVFADISFVSVSCIGLAQVRPRFNLKDGVRYSVMLSKPLGTGLAIALNRHCLLEQSGFEAVIAEMTRSNRAAFADLERLLQEDPEAVGLCTDVTGFGLGLALVFAVKGPTHVRIDVSSIPRFGPALQALTLGITTTLGDRNLLALTDRAQVDIEGLSIAGRLLVSDPQTSGGLLAIVSDEGSQDLLNVGTWAKIGWASVANESQFEFREGKGPYAN